MVRDFNKPAEFWEAALFRYRMQIQQNDSLLRHNISNEKRRRISQSVYHKRLCYLIALYSAGASMDEIQSAYYECIKQMVVVWSPSCSYVEMLWLFSIGVLLSVPPHMTDLLKRIYVAYGAYDSLLSFLLNNLDESVNKCDDLLFHEPYQVLLPITRINSQASPEPLIREYLRIWYEGHNDTWWYNNHLTEAYIGYWCFEAAALVKILRLNKEDFMSFSYFPWLEKT